MEHEHYLLSLLALTSGIISAKWAMELGFSQLSQIFWGIGGFLLGPLALLILYTRLIRNRQAMKELGGQWAYGSAATGWHEASSRADKPVVMAIEPGIHNPPLGHKA